MPGDHQERAEDGEPAEAAAQLLPRRWLRADRSRCRVRASRPGCRVLPLALAWSVHRHLLTGVSASRPLLDPTFGRADSIRRMEPQLLHSVADGVATVVIHHPAKRNAMTAGMWRALPPLLDAAGRRPRRTGAGAHRRGRHVLRRGRHLHAAGVAGRGPGRWRCAAEEALAAFPKPTLAAIRGLLRGRRLQLAAACDLRFAEEGALFGVTPAKLGIVYPASSTRRLVSLVGPGHRQVPAVLRRVDRRGAGAAHRAGRRGAARGRTRQAGRGVHPGTGLALAADAGGGQGVRERARRTGTRTGREQARGSGDTAEGVAAFLERRRAALHLDDSRRGPTG